jgi:hypothetical protein
VQETTGGTITLSRCDPASDFDTTKIKSASHRDEGNIRIGCHEYSPRLNEGTAFGTTTSCQRKRADFLNGYINTPVVYISYVGL